MKTRRSFSFLRLCRTFFTGVFSFTSLVTFSTFSAAPARAAMRDGNSTIILVHGFVPTGNYIDCAGGGSIDGFKEVMEYLSQSHDINGKSIRWNRQDFRTVGYYQTDRNCKDSLTDSKYTEPCNGYYPDGTNFDDNGTANESIYHLSCELAWYIYDNYGSHPGWNIEIVAHSMGGLIVRNMIYQVQNRDKLKTGNRFPPTLGSISDVITLSSPHGGIDKGSSLFSGCSNCTQVKELTQGSNFMNEMKNSAQNPQAANGTDWTLMGSSCDYIVPPLSAVYMEGGHKSVFVPIATCYDHEGILTDKYDINNAEIYWCDGCGLPPGDVRGNWNHWEEAPRSLHHMMYALWLSNW